MTRAETQRHRARAVEDLQAAPGNLYGPQIRSER